MGARGETEKGLKGGHRAASAVEAKGELVQVVADPVMGAPQPGLEIAEDAMDVRQDFGGALRSALGPRPVPIAESGQRSIALLWRRLLGVPEAASVRVWQLMSR